MHNGKGKHLTIMHIFTNYTITNKPIAELTPTQYKAIIVITDEIQKFKRKNKGMAVI